MLDTEEMTDEPLIEEGFVTCRKCTFDESRICNEKCMALETVEISNIFGYVNYSGLYCMRGKFKIRSIYL